jgi:hypothetical protein
MCQSFIRLQRVIRGLKKVSHPLERFTRNQLFLVTRRFRVFVWQRGGASLATSSEIKLASNSVIKSTTIKAATLRRSSDSPLRVNALLLA